MDAAGFGIVPHAVQQDHLSNAAKTYRHHALSGIPDSNTSDGYANDTQQIIPAYERSGGCVPAPGA